MLPDTHTHTHTRDWKAFLYMLTNVSNVAFCLLSYSNHWCGMSWNMQTDTFAITPNFIILSIKGFHPQMSLQDDQNAYDYCLVS